ncbi:MAG: hypothetical protein LBV73_24755 [Paraburkholderia sp.]|jgi:hypothetical protein|nr:hypothetical protein [Paraburkholderia sp.]
MRADRPYEERETNHARSYLYAFATVAVFASVFAGYVLTHRNARETAPETQIAQGAVVGTPAASDTLAANEPANASANAPANEIAPPAPMPSPVAVPMPPVKASPPPATATTPPSVATPATSPHRTTASRTEPAPRGAASLKGLRDERAAAMKRDASLRADFTRNLASARASLDKNNLGPARRSIMSALAEQPGSGEARQMQGELVSREQERDALLGYARMCVRQADWVCAWHNAGHALTIDASSGEARDLVSRAMVEQSAKGERPFDPSLDTQ